MMEINYIDMNVFMHRNAEANSAYLDCATHRISVREGVDRIHISISRKNKHQPEVGTVILDKIFKGEK